MADLFTDIFKFAGTAINQALTPDNLRDYRHASKLFVDDQYRLMPKLGFLFYVKFDINPQARFPDPANPNSEREIGMLVKSASLPKFSVDTKKFNAYNRPNYIQTKIGYDPIQITFHDDSSNVIRNFWFDYYNYYYRDSDYVEELYRSPHKYERERRSDKWGFSPRDQKGPYLNSVRLYSLHQKRFSEYVLLNPIIKSFRHGDHQQGQNETLQHDMTLEYESVLYYYGSVSPSNIPGFADLHYDKMPSPLTPAGGGTKSILGPGGLLDTGSDVVQDVKDGNYGSALFKGLKGLKTAKSMDLKKAAIGEVLDLGKGVLRGNNPQNNIFVPSLSGSSGSTDSGLGLGSGQGIGSGGGWLAGGALLGISAFSSKKSSSSEVTDASVSRGDNKAPATAKTSLPAPDPNEVFGAASAQTFSAAVVSTVEISQTTSTPTVVNGRYSRQELQNKIFAIKKDVANLNTNLRTAQEQNQLAADAIDSLNLQKQYYIQNGSVANQSIIKEIDLQIEQQNKIIEKAMEDQMILEQKIVNQNQQLELTQYQYNSLI